MSKPDDLMPDAEDSGSEHGGSGHGSRRHRRHSGHSSHSSSSHYGSVEKSNHSASGSSSDSSSHRSSGSSTHHDSGGSSRHDSDSSAHHSSGSSSHHDSGNSTHHDSGSSTHHDSGSSTHHDSGSSSHHDSGSSSHHSSGSSSHHSSGSRHTAESERRNELIQKYQVVSDDDFAVQQSAGQKKRHRRHHHHSRRFSRRRKIRRILITLVSIPLALILIAASVFAVLNVIGKRQLQKDVRGVHSNPYSITYDEGRTLEYGGQKYVLNENIITVAAIGVDREAFGLEDDKIGTAGQADFILIAAIDLKSGKVSPIMIPRDTMVDVDQYTTNGQYVGVERMQICLSFAYGDGSKTSSNNVLNSAQRAMYGIPVHLYGVLDLAGIPVLNDAIGGVSVTLPENFDGRSAGDRMVLHGRQAETFVRSRDTGRMDSDTPRRARQIEYLHAYVSKVTSAAIRDIGVIRSLYGTAMKYAFTNVSLSKVTYIATTLLSKGGNVAEVTTLPGDLQPGDPYAEYVLRDEEVFKTILSIFYIPAE